MVIGDSGVGSDFQNSQGQIRFNPIAKMRGAWYTGRRIEHLYRGPDRV